MPPLTGLEHYNDKMNTLAEHWDDFISARTMKNPNVWHDRIPRGSYALFNGLEQKTNIYRGGLPVQAGLSTWNDIGLSRKPDVDDPGYDNCAMGTPHTYSYAWETVQYTGFQDEWQSEPVCLSDMKFIDFAKDQLNLIVRTGVEYGISMLENWNREQYVLQAALSNRTMVMAEGSLEFEDDATYRFAYDPFAVTTDVDGESVPFITMNAELNMSTLNWDYLDYLRTTLADRAGEAALGVESGMPIFGLMIDLIDFEKMIKTDADLRADWREAMPRALIDGYSMGMKMYRGFALIHDSRQMRFRVRNIDATTGDLVATRVLPLRAGRAATIGNVPEPNPAYYRAEVGIGVIFMNDVIQNLFVPSIDNLGSGMSFGPAPGLTGEWRWMNIRDNVSNQLGETGYFYGRFQIFPKPLLFAHDCTVFAYRRCPQALRTVCAVETSTGVVAAGAAVALSQNAVAADFDLTNRQVTLTLVSKLPAGVHDAVTVDHAAGGNDTPMQLISDALAPKYVFAWADGASNAPTAFTDFTTANSADVTA
jgi:hypothetical protein